MTDKKIRGVFLADNPSDGLSVMDVLRDLADREGFDRPESYMVSEPLPNGQTRLTVTTELGENLLACARWKGCLTLRREK